MASFHSTTRSTASRGQQTFADLQHFYSSKTSATSPSPTKLPTTTPERLASTTSKTILYLAYGSNLSAKTFKGARGIKPLSALNVHVPSLDLTFDLAGIPYTEPCFANTRWRNTIPAPASDYHKDRWHKGLIGVVYEVTPEDYRIIIATEGGGASYQDVVVSCYALPAGEKIVAPIPAGAPFSAHTLLRPQDDSEARIAGGIIRPDPSYAQASARYLALITTGGEEHSLPEEYMTYLYNIRPYTITTKRQAAGRALITTVWLPIVFFIFGLGRTFADKNGKIPVWLATMLGLVFSGLWGTYDGAMKGTFGDGERTIGDGVDDEERDVEGKWSERSGGSEYGNEKGAIRLEEDMVR